MCQILLCRRRPSIMRSLTKSTLSINVYNYTTAIIVTFDLCRMDSAVTWQWYCMVQGLYNTVIVIFHTSLPYCCWHFRLGLGAEPRTESVRNLAVAARMERKRAGRRRKQAKDVSVSTSSLSSD